MTNSYPKPFKTFLKKNKRILATGFGIATVAMAIDAVLIFALPGESGMLPFLFQIPGFLIVQLLTTPLILLATIVPSIASLEIPASSNIFLIVFAVAFVFNTLIYGVLFTWIVSALSKLRRK